MNVLSLFDGMSCGQIAFDKLGIKFDGKNNKYFAAEIKPHAKKVAKENYPNTIDIGDVTKISYHKGVLKTENGEFKVGKIDLLIGGSPCQSISILNTKKGIYDGKSDMFFEYLRIFNEVKPKYFLLENVNGHKESLDAISNWIGVTPVNINSNLVSFQNRDRLYWTNIPGITIPIDKKISFQDYKETDPEICIQYKVNKTPSRERMWGEGKKGQCPNVTGREKINCLTCKQDRWSNAGLIEFEDFCRYLTVKECELAQTVPIGYTSCLTRSQAYDVLGDGWTVDVIAHILKNIKEQNLIKTA